jgi:hypothetical protein
VAYACKLCVWDKKLVGDKFLSAEHWFQSPDDFADHMNQNHRSTTASDVQTRAGWPGMLEEAQAVAEGYQIGFRDVDATSLQFTCYRCDATTIHPKDIQNLRCLSCGRTYKNFYSSWPVQLPEPSQGI